MAVGSNKSNGTHTKLGKPSTLNGGSAVLEKLDSHVNARTALPSRHTSHGGDVWRWCKEKAQLDSRRGGSENVDLWLVHGKWYDLSKFIDKHPGGRDWLELTRGQDITEAYEVHHIHMEKVEAVLKKYYVKDANSDYVGRYFWDKGNFYTTLKERVAKVYARSPDGLPDTKATPFFIGLSVAAFVVHALTFFFALGWPSLLSAVIAGFTLQTFHGIGHNALHQKDNIWMYFYDFCGWKHHKHRISHALSHHLHPNTQLDLEFPDQSFVFTSNGHLNSRLVILIGPLAMWSGPLRDIFKLWIGLAQQQEKWRPEYAINMVQLALMVLFAGPVTGLMQFCVMHFVCGFCIECAGFGLHRSSFCWTDGDGNAKYEYAEHCLAATADHDVDMGLVGSLYLFQILNNHGIHHLFPTIDKSRIHEIMPIFRDTCKEFNVPWKEYDWRDMFGSLWKVWLRGLYNDTPMITTRAYGHAPVPGSNLRITPLEGYTIGAEVSGVKIQDMSREELDVVQQAYSEYGVLVFHDQDMAPEDEVAFATKFPHNRICDLMKYCGPLAKEGFDADEWRKFKLPGRPEIQLRGNYHLKDHYGVTGHLQTGKGAKEFHTDSVHEYDTPPIYTSLYCLASPGGDDTLFIDCRAAYDRLSAAEKQQAESLFVQYKQVPSPLHESGLKADFNASLNTLGDLYGSCVERSGNAPVEVSQVHPLVWTHPVTGRKAVLSAAMWMHTIVEKDGTLWSPEDSHDYIYSLLHPVVKHQYGHKWAVGDLVCFDNRTVMHSAAAVAPGTGGGRLLHQIILAGDRIPVGPAGVGVDNPTVNPNVVPAR